MLFELVFGFLSLFLFLADLLLIKFLGFFLLCYRNWSWSRSRSILLDNDVFFVLDVVGLGEVVILGIVISSELEGLISCLFGLILTDKCLNIVYLFFFLYLFRHNCVLICIDEGRLLFSSLCLLFVVVVNWELFLLLFLLLFLFWLLLFLLLWLSDRLLFGIFISFISQLLQLVFRENGLGKFIEFTLNFVKLILKFLVAFIFLFQGLNNILFHLNFFLHLGLLIFIVLFFDVLSILGILGILSFLSFLSFLIFLFLFLLIFLFLVLFVLFVLLLFILFVFLLLLFSIFFLLCFSNYFILGLLLFSFNLFLSFFLFALLLINGILLLFKLSSSFFVSLLLDLGILTSISISLFLLLFLLVFFHLFEHATG